MPLLRSFAFLSNLCPYTGAKISELIRFHTDNSGKVVEIINVGASFHNSDYVYLHNHDRIIVNCNFFGIASVNSLF